MGDGVEREGVGVNVRLNGEDKVGESRPCGVVVADGLVSGDGLIREIERGEDDVIRARGVRYRRRGLGG